MSVRASCLVAVALFALGCQSASPRSQAAADASVASAPAGERHFGAPSAVPGPALQVAQVLAEPEPYLNKTIKCEGTVARVCEAAGCWLELRGEGKLEGLRVPMAGHSFFVPRDAVGRPAIIEGTLAARELSQAELDHLQAEGLKAIGPLYLTATTVVIR